MEIEATINLDNYENIRIKVEAETYPEIQSQLTDILNQLGTTSEYTRTKIITYAKNVLGLELTPYSPKPITAPSAPDPTIPKNPVETFPCESCGAEVSKCQKDVSLLFMNKILCKPCMNK